ncbi:MAG: DUF4861 domain-containing protein [Paludibacter sp.]|nr:DUF4861 domain-containing protein [Paludibacter sp.]
MKTKFLLSAFLLASFTLPAAQLKITVKNPNLSDVKNAPIVLKLAKYSKIKTKDRAKLAIFVNNEQISSQLDDLNHDGTPDELIFLLDMKASGSQKVIVKTIRDKKRKKFPTEVYTDLIKKNKNGKHQFVTEVSSDKNNMYNQMHHHGVAFESSIMAYRIYFDNKSTIDIYGKKKQRLEIADTGWYPTDKQLAEGYGDDILLVSGWVGVGTVKGWNGEKATHIDKFDKRTQRIVATGNLRTVVESEVEGWQYEGKKINMTVRYILYARHRDAQCEITASEDIDNLATGVQQIGEGELLQCAGLVGSWGTYFPQPDSVKYGKETVGLGVHVPQRYFGKQVQSGVNNLILMPYKKGETLHFYLTAAWNKEEKDPYLSADQFFAYLKNWENSLQDLVVE